jgi:copper chaperone CopZ
VQLNYQPVSNKPAADERKITMTNRLSAVRGRARLLITLLLALTLVLHLPTANGQDDNTDVGPQRIKHQITGLFMPERVKDLHVLFEKLPDMKLVKVDYENSEAVIEYEPGKLWPNEKPEKFPERLDNHLRSPSRGTFGAKSLRTTPRKKLELIEIPVVGLDCKGCSYAAYLLVFKLPGVERATSSFKAGKVTALIDPKQTDQKKLEEALRKGGVEVSSSSE